MKKYFKVSFQYAESVYCSNIAHAETAEDVLAHYSKYEWVSTPTEANEREVESAKERGMPIIECDHIEPTQTEEQNEVKKYYVEGCIIVRDSYAKTLADGEKFDIWFTYGTVRHYDEDGDLICVEEMPRPDDALRVYPVLEERIQNAQSLDALDAIIEEAAEVVENAESYERIYALALAKGQSWQPQTTEDTQTTAETAEEDEEQKWLDSLPECTKYARSIAREVEDLFSKESEWSDEEREERESNGDPCDILDYLTQNALDIEYTLDSNRELVGVAVYVTLGGPTCYLDTRRQEVVCHWGNEVGRWGLSGEVCDYINELERDIFCA